MRTCPRCHGQLPDPTDALYTRPMCDCSQSEEDASEQVQTPGVAAVAIGSPPSPSLNDLSAACFARWREYQQAAEKHKASGHALDCRREVEAEMEWADACAAWCRANEAALENNRDVPTSENEERK